MIYPGCSLGKILKLERRPVEIVPDKKYAEIGIYCFGKGIFHKEPRSGLEVGDKKLFQIKEGDLILQVTFAWEGAVGLASKKEDGMHGSTRFPTFRVNEDLCYPSFLLNYFKTKEGREQLIKISPGSAGRNRVLSLKRIHEVMIPLPPIDEQRRIVARIEELTARIEEARELRRRAVEESGVIISARISQLFLKHNNNERLTGRLGDYVIDDCYGTSEKTTDDSSGTPVLRMGNIQNGCLDVRDLKYLHISGKDRAKLILRKGDILVNRTNSAELVLHNINFAISDNVFGVYL
jgi:type I restriction enzyme S subunit